MRLAFRHGFVDWFLVPNILLSLRPLFMNHHASDDRHSVVPPFAVEQH